MPHFIDSAVHNLHHLGHLPQAHHHPLFVEKQRRKMVNKVNSHMNNWILKAPAGIPKHLPTFIPPIRNHFNGDPAHTLMRLL